MLGDYDLRMGLGYYCRGFSGVEHHERSRKGHTPYDRLWQLHESNGEPRAVRGYENLTGDLGALTGSIGTYPSNADLILESIKRSSSELGACGSSLSIIPSGLRTVSRSPHRVIQEPRLNASEHSDEKRGDSRDNSAPLKPPVGRRVVFPWSTIGLLFPGFYFGCKLVDCGRNRIGIALIVGCYGLFALGLTLIVLSRFSWSRRWRL